MHEHSAGPARGAVSTRAVRALYAGGILACAALMALHLVRAASGLESGTLLATLLGAVLGALAADVVTGGVHWACDTWGDETTPWIGAGVIRSFHEHHRAPGAMLSHDWIEVNGQPALAAALALAALAPAAAAERLLEHPLLYGFALALAGIGALANQLHQWAHHPAPPAAVRALQRSGWILPPACHARHHRAPHTGDYCISGGWLNAPLDALGVWRALERVVSRFTGLRPRAGSGGPAAPPPQPATVPLPQPQRRRHDEAGRMARQGSHR